MDDFFADRLAVAVVAVAADPGDAGDVGKVQVAGVGDPDGAADDAAVAAVQFCVVRLAGAFLLDGVEDGPLQEGLVSLPRIRTCTSTSGNALLLPRQITFAATDSAGGGSRSSPKVIAVRQDKPGGRVDDELVVVLA
jgi:hypothetical protein